MWNFYICGVEVGIWSPPKDTRLAINCSNKFKVFQPTDSNTDNAILLIIGTNTRDVKR